MINSVDLVEEMDGEDICARNDLQDLLFALHLRFGSLDNQIVSVIEKIGKFTTTNQPILIAANVRSLKDFLEELGKSGDEFKITGEKYYPLDKWDQRRKWVIQSC